VKITQVIAIVLLVIVVFCSGCLEHENQRYSFNPSKKNIDPVLVLSSQGMITPPPNIATNIPIDGYAYAGDQVTFDASKSYDPDGTISSYQWLVDEKNTIHSESIITTSYKFETLLFENPAVVSIILSIEDSNGSIVYDTYHLGILPKKADIYLTPNSLQPSPPPKDKSQINAYLSTFRVTQPLLYASDTPFKLQACTWNLSLHVSKPLFSYIHSISISYYNTTGNKFFASTSTMNFFGFWKERAILFKGTFHEPVELQTIEINIKGFSLRKAITIHYGGEHPSLLTVDFTHD
jgi:hypothetical protein